ncbi:hypothetical protein J6590_067779 [Homalodisca vitripennis]|nr:hypothetical protein J6590_067779 [Homalodisca vitripennis]
MPRHDRAMSVYSPFLPGYHPRHITAFKNLANAGNRTSTTTKITKYMAELQSGKHNDKPFQCRKKSNLLYKLILHPLKKVRDQGKNISTCSISTKTLKHNGCGRRGVK